MANLTPWRVIGWSLAVFAAAIAFGLVLTVLSVAFEVARTL